MNGTPKRASMKGYLIAFGIAVVANIIAGIVVAKFILKSNNEQLAQKSAVQQPPRQVTTTQVTSTEGEETNT